MQFFKNIQIILVFLYNTMIIPVVIRVLIGPRQPFLPYNAI